MFLVIVYTYTLTFILLQFDSVSGYCLSLAHQSHIIIFLQRDFLSIELVEGKVHLTFELGSGPLTLTSTKVYNTGVWYKIAMNRNKRKGKVKFLFITHY